MQIFSHSQQLALMAQAVFLISVPNIHASALAESIDLSAITLPNSILPTRWPVSKTIQANWLVGAKAYQFHAVDAVPVRAYSGAWQDYNPRNGNNAALQITSAEAIATAPNGWEFSAVGRSEVLIEGSRDTFDITHFYKQRLQPNSDTHFDTNAHEKGVVMAGLRLAHSWDLGSSNASLFNNLRLTTAASIWSVRRVQIEGIAGTINYSSGLGYAFNANTVQSNSGKNFGGYGLKDTMGKGYSVDLGLMWRPNQRSFINLSLVDLLSRVRVSQVSGKLQNFSSITNSYDSQGYLNYTPVLTGRYLSNEISTSLERKASLVFGTVLDTSLGFCGVGGRLERIGTINLPSLWTSLPMSSGFNLALDVDFRFHSIGVGIANRYGAVQLRTRSLPVGSTHAFGWSLEFKVPL